MVRLASETLALEYGDAFGFPVWINRCGLLAGGGQFGRPDQGIVAFWIHAWREGRPLRYIGFDGQGHQVRDCLHPVDLAILLEKQIGAPATVCNPRIINVSGGPQSAFSLRQLSNWCEKRFGPAEVESSPQERRYDLPWLILDNTLAKETWDWAPSCNLEFIFDEIAVHATSNPNWLKTSGV